MKKIICFLMVIFLCINQMHFITFANSNCKVTGCNIPVYADGYCIKHYQDSRCIEKDCTNEKKKGNYCEKHYKQNMICKFEGCNNEVFKDEYCELHYKGKALTDVAIDYALGLIPFGIGGLAKDTISILAEDNDMKKVYGEYKKRAEKEFEVIKFGKLPSVIEEETKEIEWYVIDEKDDEKLLLSKGNYIGLPYIDTTGNPYMTQKEYDDLWYSTKKEDENKIKEYDDNLDNLSDEEIKYKDSFIRNYLNNNFINEAFDDEEKSRICEHKINTIHFNDIDKVEYLEETVDKAYPIGMNEINKYFENNTELLYSEGKTGCDKYAETQNMQFYLRDVGFEKVFDKKYQSPFYACFNFIRDKKTINGVFNIKKNPYVGKRYETRILIWIKK